MINDLIRRRISFASLLAIALVFVLSGTAWAQDEDEEEEEESKALDKVLVTGSRIRKTDIEGASPVYVLTSEQIEEEGFVTVFDALSTLTQSTGFTQAEAYTNQFTPAAPQLNLRGLGPGRTLVLLNGRRAADYPFPFNGSSNFVNLQQIPTIAVQRIEVLAGGASAIYGSDAVAGVINIITKDEVDASMISARVGTTEQGGGDSQRFQFLSGASGDKWNLVYGYEYFNRDPIFGNDRDWLDERSDFPGLEQVNTRSLLYIGDSFGYDWDGDGLTYQDPGAAICDSFVDLEYSERPGRGFYCGRDSTGDESIRNQRENHSVYANFTYDINAETSFFATLNYWEGDITSTGFRRWWGSPFPFWNPGDTGPDGDAGRVFLGTPASLALFQRIFQPSETGEQSNTFEEKSMDISLGFSGYFGDGNWGWELAYSHSEYESLNEQFYFKEELIDGYFLGTERPDLSAFGIPWWDVPADWRERLYTPMTPELIAALSGKLRDPADSSNDTIQAVINGELFDMPAGPVGFAAIAEWGTQEYQLNPDERTLNRTGQGWWGRNGTGGGGERDRYAVGVEMNFPLSDTLTVPIAARWDKYDDASDVDDAVTWNAGFEWRPTERFLLRGTAATSFRAPDMHFLFAGPSGFFTSVTDYYLCRRDEPESAPTFSSCSNSSVQVEGSRQGNIFLEEEEGESYTFGFVWEAFEGFSFNMDLYNVKLENIVNDESLNNLMIDEANCRLGSTTGGTAVDGNSTFCQRIYDRIIRINIPGAPNNELVSDVTVGPINRSLSEQTGIDAGFNYTWGTEGGSLFNFTGFWSHVLESKRQEFAEDPVDDEWRDSPLNFEFRHRFRGSLAWSKGDFHTVLTGIQVGSVPNWAETDRMDQMWTYNLSVDWQYSDTLSFSVLGTNILNENPEQDPSWPGWPGFSRGNFSPVGAEWWVSANWIFGE